MKIGRLLLKNVTSYREATEFVLDPHLNILIGPNGGGKSNLQKVIAVVLTQFFVRQYQVRTVESRSVLEPLELYNKQVLASTLSKFVGDESSQLIEIAIVPEESDVQNILMIAAHLDKFNQHLSVFDHKYERFAPADFADEIGMASAFSYSIVDLTLEEDTAPTARAAFREYLQHFFVFMRVASKVPEATLTSPIFFFSSDRALTKSFEVQAGQLTEDQYHSGFRSAFSAATGQTNLLQWGAQHFVRLYRRSQAKAGRVRDKITEDFLRSEPDVQLLDRYLTKLGYKWTFYFDDDQTRYKFALERDGIVIFDDLFSSGEREIVHFLLAMCALNVRDGLVLVDEPELHLHPRWQMIFLGLFRDLAPERRNQFIICTHSPIFVTPDTINSVIRVYKGGMEGSRKVSLGEVALPNKAKLVRMINSQNNERLFFADKVVLVEGPSDRLVFASLLEATAVRFGDNSTIEVVDVGGKHNFDSYQALLDALRTPWITIADRDYLAQIGSPTVRGLFVPDTKRLVDTLLDDKRSVDRSTLVDSLREAIRDNDLRCVRPILKYIEERHRRFKSDCDATETAAVASDISRLASVGVLILDGEIEDYLPGEVTAIAEIVEFVSERNWISKVPEAGKRKRLVEIACIVFDVKGSARTSFLDGAQRGERLFPGPVISGNSTQAPEPTNELGSNGRSAE